ncbi:MAG: metal ABC transporter permease [Corynebacterium sp.]|nr:metal ABC transporter permease [Corynebacterium sp.]
MSFALSACLLAVATAIACAIPGVFVVLKGDSMVIDGIGHSVLPGIAIGYLFTHDLGSPWLFACAAVAALLVSLGTEKIGRSNLMPRDAALGIIFPALFSLGVVLITTKFAHVHLDVHAVLVGDMNLVALSSPHYIFILTGVGLVNAAFVISQLPRLTASSCDPLLFPARGMHVIFHILVAATATAAFQTAGAMLVIALMVLPAIIARLLCKRVPTMLALSVVFSIISALVGFWISYHLNVATASGMTLTNAAFFIAALLYYTQVRNRRGKTPTPASPQLEPLPA